MPLPIQYSPVSEHATLLPRRSSTGQEASAVEIYHVRKKLRDIPPLSLLMRPDHPTCDGVTFPDTTSAPDYVLPSHCE